MAETGLASIISNLTTVVTAVAGYISTWVATITASGNEVLLLGAVLIPLVGIGIGAFKRMLSTRV